MNNKNIVINPTTSGISVDLDFQLLPDHANLVKKYREKLKLPDRPLDLNILVALKRQVSSSLDRRRSHVKSSC